MTEAAAQIEALRAADRSFREPVEATDEAGAVTMSAEDLLVSSVKLSQAWDKDADGALDQLSAVVAEAYEAIGQAMRVRYFEVLEAARQRASTAPTAARQPARRREPRQMQTPDERQVDAVIARLNQDFADLQKLEREQPPQAPRTPQPDREVVGTSENGRLRAVFTVAADDDTLTRLEADPHWLLRQSRLQIADMVKQAMNDGLTTMRESARPEPNPYQQMSEQFGRSAAAAAQVSRLAGLR